MSTKPLIVLSVLAGSSLCLAQVPNPEDIEFRDGAAVIPDRATFKRLSYQSGSGRDAYLNLLRRGRGGLEVVKFILQGAGTRAPKLYWMNTKTRQAHPKFMEDLGVAGGIAWRNRGVPGADRLMRGTVAYRPRVRAPNGTVGTYTYNFLPNDSFELDLLASCHEMLIKKAPFLAGKLVYHPLTGDLPRYMREKAQFAKANLPVYLDEVLNTNIAFLPMNPGQTFGRLRRMGLEEIPNPRDVVLYESLPNELPRVAGMITGVRQTPLSHVNLRAIQDRVPNAYVAGAAQSTTITALIGKLVRYTVRSDGYTIREATQEEVEAHFKTLRPASAQTPPLDLSVTAIRALDKIAYGEASAFGVKTTNLAAMRKFALPKGMIPDGFGVPFHFYDAFMKHNGLDKRVTRLCSKPGDAKQQESALKQLRDGILSGEVPEFMLAALSKVERSFARGTPIRCRSSTNNEDLPGFSGAGLYESRTHAPGEGHLAETVKKVFASLWSERAFEEREFYRVDHRKTAMGVLLHPSYKKERANGVAVTLDVLYQRDGFNYVNSQVGENMVTNPEARSIPEEILLPWQHGEPQLMQASNRVDRGKRVLGETHLNTLQKALETIHDEFAKHYGRKKRDPKHAMEVEFKVTKDGVLAIKQARPWVFAESR